MIPTVLFLGFWMAIPILWSRRNAAVIAVGALLVAVCAAWGVAVSTADDAGDSAFVSGFGLAAVNAVVGLALGLALFGAMRGVAAATDRLSRR